MTLVAIAVAAHWAIHLGGGMSMGGSPFSATSTFTEFAEEGSITARHEPSTGPAFEAGLWRGVSRRLGIALVFERGRRDAAGTFAASLPHPLYLDRHRSVEGPLPAGAQRETAIHFGLAWSVTGGGITARFTGGPSYMLAEADLVEQVEHTDAYPFDSVRVTGVRASAVRGDALGGHAGLVLERRVASRLAVGIGARWAQATIPLARGSAADGERSARVRAGGFSATGAFRLYF